MAACYAAPEAGGLCVYVYFALNNGPSVIIPMRLIEIPPTDEAGRFGCRVLYGFMIVPFFADKALVHTFTIITIIAVMRAFLAAEGAEAGIGAIAMLALAFSQCSAAQKQHNHCH